MASLFSLTIMLRGLRLGVIFRRQNSDEIIPFLALRDASRLLELSQRFKKVLTGHDHSESHQLQQLSFLSCGHNCIFHQDRHEQHLSTAGTTLRKSLSLMVSLSCAPSRSVLDGLNCTGLGTVVLLLQLIN